MLRAPRMPHWRHGAGRRWSWAPDPIVNFAYAAHLMLVTRRQFRRLRRIRHGARTSQRRAAGCRTGWSRADRTMADLTSEMETILATIGPGPDDGRRQTGSSSTATAGRSACSTCPTSWSLRARPSAPSSNTGGKSNRSGREEEREVFARERMVVDRPHTQGQAAGWPRPRGAQHSGVTGGFVGPIRTSRCARPPKRRWAISRITTT